MGNNLLFVFLGWEGVGFCSYALIGFSAYLAGAVIFFLILGLGVLPAPLLNLIARLAALFPI